MREQSVSRFWDNYIEKTKTYNIKPAAVRWYVRYAESYIKSHINTKLINHPEHFVKEYLKDKGRQKRLEDWQFQQIVTSLKILFTDMVNVSWGDTFPWDEYHSMAKSLPKDHATVARDYQNIEVNLDDLENKEDLTVTPLAIPLLTGPGAITTSIVLFNLSNQVIDKITLIVCIVLVFIISYIILSRADLIFRFLGKTGTRVFVRLMGLMLFALAVQFIIDGIIDGIKQAALI